MVWQMAVKQNVSFFSSRPNTNAQELEKNVREKKMKKKKNNSRHQIITHTGTN
jgi:hypothetical protein